MNEGDNWGDNAGIIWGIIRGGDGGSNGWEVRGEMREIMGLSFSYHADRVSIQRRFFNTTPTPHRKKIFETVCPIICPFFFSMIQLLSLFSQLQLRYIGIYIPITTWRIYPNSALLYRWVKYLLLLMHYRDGFKGGIFK